MEKIQIKGEEFIGKVLSVNIRENLRLDLK
jgi:hypothetical protein